MAFAGLKNAASAMNIRLISADDQQNSVARGGLSLYPVNEPDILPIGCWYAVRDEVFNYARHPDVIKKVKGVPQWRLRNGMRHALLNPKLTKPSMIGDDSSEAIDRLALIARTMEIGGIVETHCVPYSFLLDAEWTPRLEFEIYFSEKYEPNGKPLRDKFGNMRSLMKV